MRKNKKINIIYKDEQIVVCEKPKGIPVSSDKTGDMDLLHQLKNQLFFEENTEWRARTISGTPLTDQLVVLWYLQEQSRQQHH